MDKNKRITKFKALNKIFLGDLSDIVSSAQGRISTHEQPPSLHHMQSLQILGTNQASDRETISGKSKISGLESISHLSSFKRSSLALQPELGSWKLKKMQIKSHKSIKLTSEEQQQASERHLVSADAKSRTYSFQFCV